MKTILILVCFACLLSCHSSSGKDDTLSTLPAFNIQLTDSTTILNAAAIPVGKPTIILFFRPDCTHCQAETQSLLSHIDSLQNVRIYMLASAPLAEIKGFYNHFHLDQYKNFTVGKDYDHSFARVFRPASVPYMAIYNSEKQLIKIYAEEAGIENILKSVRS